MQLLKDRIRKDGKIKGGNVLKVDSFLNHQMDIKLFEEIGKEFKRRFADVEVNKILTLSLIHISMASGQCHAENGINSCKNEEKEHESSTSESNPRTCLLYTSRCV